MTRLSVGQIGFDVQKEDVIGASRRRLVLDLLTISAACAGVIALLLPRTYTTLGGLVVAAVLLPIVLVGAVTARLQAHRSLRQTLASDHLVLGARPSSTGEIARPRVSLEGGQRLSAEGRTPTRRPQ